MNAFATVALAAAMALGGALPAEACTRARPSGLLALDEDWRGALTEWFSAAYGVFVVEVRSGGPLADGPGAMACDTFAVPPPPPARRASGVERRAYAAEQRRVAAAQTACTPETAMVQVMETLKGPPIDGWVETFAYIDVTDAPPVEPAPWPGQPDGAATAYGAAVQSRFGLMCDGVVYARRLSTQATYVVFAFEVLNGPPLVVTHALWADPRAPFVAEVRRLATMRDPG